MKILYRNPITRTKEALLRIFNLNKVEQVYIDSEYRNRIRLPNDSEFSISVNLKKNFHEEVDAYGLVVNNIESCLQCGKCTGACPVARVSPSFNPRQIVRDILMGQRQRWLDSEEIWRCFWCAGCYSLCPVGIHFPLLIMQVRYRALENRHGMKYAAIFKRFALRALKEGLTFTPSSPKGRERIMSLRSRLGLSPWPEISEKAREEYRALFDLTGTTSDLEEFSDDSETLVLKYLEGRITGA